MARFLKAMVLMVWMNLALSEANDQDMRSKLLSDLRLRDYDNEVPPTKDGPVNVEIGFTLLYFDFIDEANELATVNGWLELGWTDPRLSWDKDAYGNLSYVVKDLKDIWIPDIEIHNSARAIQTHDTKALLYSSGRFYWVSSYHIEFICRMDLQFFPYDKQKCQLKYSSWSYHGFLLNLTASRSKIAIDDYMEARDFVVTDTAAQTNVVKYDCCDEPHHDVKFTIWLKRSSNAYGTKLVLPAVLTGVMALLTFLIPPASYEKVTLCGNLFLCLLLQLIYLHLIIQSVGDTMLGEYLAFALFIDLFATVMAVVSYNINMTLSPMQPVSMDTEGGEKLQMPRKERKGKEWLRHLDKVSFVLFSIVFIIGVAIILGRRG